MVPFFNGEMHGTIVRVQLDMKGKKRPRPARYHEFCNFNSPNGVGPYEGQVQLLNLENTDSRLKGFQGGFSSTF